MIILHVLLFFIFGAIFIFGILTMDGFTLVMFLLLGSITLFIVNDFLFAHKYTDGPSATKKSLMSPLYYFFGYECECGAKFLSRKKYEDHIRSCSRHDLYKDFHGWGPKF